MKNNTPMSWRNLLKAIALFFVTVSMADASVPVKGLGTADVLLFAGDGTSRNDVASIEAILSSSRISYVLVSSLQLNRMERSAFSEYRLLIVAGGDFLVMGNSLTASTATNVRSAVNGGLNYLGICAGGFLAGYFPAPYKSFDLSSGVKFVFYSAERDGIRKAAVRITTAQGPTLDQYWEDGPQLSGWGDVVGTYPDGTPAIVEGAVGKGWVILSGVHAEAPARWRRGMAFGTTVRADNAYAQTLILAALHHAALPHY